MIGHIVFRVYFRRHGWTSMSLPANDLSLETESTAADSATAGLSFDNELSEPASQIAIRNMQI
jgi:hypothetical protein